MKIQKSKKDLVRWLIEFGILLVIVIAFVVVNKKIDRENEKKETEGYVYSIEKILFDESSNEISISGWCVKEGLSCPNEESRKGLKILLAKDGRREDVIEIPVESFERPDVVKYLKDEVIDYTYSGFRGIVKADASVKNNRYRILIQYDPNEEKFYYTNRYFDKGELVIDHNQWD